MSLNEATQKQLEPGETCPLTAMPILCPPEWQEISFGKSYRLTVRLIGDTIIHSQPSGYVTVHDARGAISLFDEVEQQVPAGRSWVLISDYSRVQGASLEARRCFIDYLKSKQQEQRLAGVVVYAAPSLLKLSITLARSIRLQETSVVMAESYEEAMRYADTLLKNGQPNRSGSIDMLVGEEPSPWQLQLIGFSVRYQRLDERTVHGIAEGYLREDHVMPILDLSSRIVAEMQAPRPLTFVLDLSRLRSVTLAARRRFVSGSRDQQGCTSLGMLVCYGANAMMRGAIAISRPYLPFELLTVTDRESAMAALRRHRKPGLWRRLLHWLDRSPESRNRKHMDDLLCYLASIDWDDDLAGHGEPPTVDHPLGPAFDGLTLIKAEVDHLLRQQRQTELALRRSEERYRDILRSIVDGYYEIDLSGTVTFANESLLRMLGLCMDELLGRSYRTITNPRHTRIVRVAFNRVFASSEPVEAIECELVRSDGTRIATEISISLMCTTDNEPFGFRGIVRDVSERQQAARERERLELQLRHAQRMEAIGTLAGGIAHNFNNLLMGIQGNAAVMGRSGNLDPALRQRLATIESLVRGGARLTGQLLDYARDEPFEIRPLNLNELVSNTADTVSLTHREIRVHLHLADDLPQVLGDREQLAQVLLNLLINAVEAMPTGGDLIVTTSPLPAGKGTGQYPELEAEQLVCLEVADTGIGMDERTLERIFEPFFTTKGLTGGTGLGLASSYGIIKAHSGVIEAESKLGLGSRLRVLLPATDEPVAEVVVDQEEGVVKGQGKILVVDDDAAVLEATAFLLASIGYTPITAATGGQALEHFGHNADDIRLVVLDMVLPDMNGASVYRSLKQINPETRVLLASGYSIDGDASDILASGCDDFIQKPFSIEELSRRIAVILEH